MTDFLHAGPANAAATVLLAHGAGAPMDSAWMNTMTERLAERGLRVARFEFSYMASRRTAAGRKPPPRAETLVGEYRDAVDALAANGRLYIGGKSMGGRVASMAVSSLHAAGKVAGLICLGYPFHPPGQPTKLRTAHLAALTVPALICQGERDPFGTRAEVSAYPLSGRVELCWLRDGDHDLRPRKAMGLTLAANLDCAADRIAAFAAP